MSLPHEQDRPARIPRGATPAMSTASRVRRRFALTPARLVPLAFLAVITTGTFLLSLPVSTRTGVSHPLTAAFTTVSAVCVTGLVTVDTATFWTPFGQAVIIALIQIGGLGIMTLATLIILALTGRLGLRTTLLARAENKTLDHGEVRLVLRRIVVSVAVAEGVVAALLTARFRVAYDDDLPTALWHGGFHAVSAFNNAGFALFSSNLVAFVADPWIIVPICAAIIAGGFGFPVFFELLSRWRRPQTWSVHTRLTVVGYTVLFLVGIGTFLVFEWRNPGTLGALDLRGKLLGGLGGGVFPRTAGFNSIDYGAIRPETLVVHLVLMFIGGGSGGTAGGVKVTTFFLLAFVILSEVRGEAEVRIGNRRIAPAAQRQALSVALLSVGLVTSATIGLVMTTHVPLDRIAFEVVSAFGTVGLSMNVTPTLPPPAQLVIMAVMFCGRVGPFTVASALALTDRTRLYHLPEEYPVVG